ncbi:MAG: glucosaminidase domain-containing protein [Prolixibacteraceae bacterium]|nr:glucosaminidase domain-containing protein [Prolixibacteraceae bacterium]
MKKTILGIIIFFVCITVDAQMTRTEYIKKYQLLAIEEMNRSGIPASIKMAQACLESGNGNSELSRKSNNHFGIKCKSSWNGQKVYYDDDEANECFRKYKTVEDSYIDHTNFLMNNPRYFALFQLPSDDYIGWAKGLKKAGYATASDYDKRLIRIIEENKLHRLDYRLSFEELAATQHDNMISENISDRLTINPYNIHSISKVNGVKAVIAREGDTFEVIAQELGLKPWELYKFNDHLEGYRPQTNEIIYIEAKNRKTSKRILTHIVEPNETMHYISQLYGIKLKPLYRRNEMKFGTQPIIGQEIFLHSKKRK